MASPTARSLKYLRDAGYVADVVERWLPKVDRRRDFLGCIDILAVHALEAGVLGVQATSRPNLAARATKARGRAELRAWLRAGNRFEVWGWECRSGRWQPVRQAVSLEDLDPGAAVVLPKRRRKSRQRDLFARG